MVRANRQSVAVGDGNSLLAGTMLGYIWACRTEVVQETGRPRHVLPASVGRASRHHRAQYQSGPGRWRHRIGPAPGGRARGQSSRDSGPGLTRRPAGRVKFSQKHCGPEGRPGRDRRTEFDSGGVGPGIEGGHRDSHGTQQPENRCENPEPRRRVRASKSQRALGQSRAGCPLKGHESVVDRHTATSSRPQL